METVIAPSVGHAPVNIQAGVGASPGFDAVDYRRAWGNGLIEGVVHSAAWLAHENSGGPNMTVTVDANVEGAYVQGDAVSVQGIYYVPPHNAAIVFDIGTHAPPDPTSPRIDRIVLQVFDDTHDGSGLNEAKLVYLAGTATGGATLDNETGAVALPGGAFEVATVLVVANATSISDSDIRDKRPCGGDRRHDVGEIIYKASSTSTEPFGCIPADARELKRNQYSELFGDIGTTHGAGDGSTTFNVPDHRSRSPIGAGAGAGLSNRTVGQLVGSETHTLSVGEMPNHNHPDAGHIHPTHITNWSFTSFAIQEFATSAGTTGVMTATGSSSVGNADTDSGTANPAASGGGGAHDNMQPSIGLLAYIYTGKA